MPPTPDKMERARRDKRFKLAQKELEPMFSEMINKFMAEKDGQTVTVHFQTPVVGSVTVEVAQAVNGLPHGPDGV